MEMMLCSGIKGLGQLTWLGAFKVLLALSLTAGWSMVRVVACSTKRIVARLDGLPLGEIE